MCKELFLIFANYVLPLNTKLICQGPASVRTKHLRNIIHQLIDERIKNVVDQMTTEALDRLYDDSLLDNDSRENGMTLLPTAGNNQLDSITNEEVDFFQLHELPHIDEREYFRRHLGLDPS